GRKSGKCGRGGSWRVSFAGRSDAVPPRIAGFMDQIGTGLDLRTILWTCGETFVISLVLTPILRDIFRAYHFVDRPGFRKIHAYPIPRLGGIAIAAAYTAGQLGLNIDK